MCSRASPFLVERQICLSGDHRFQNFFPFKPFIAARGQPECQPDASIHARAMHTSSQSTCSSRDPPYPYKVSSRVSNISSGDPIFMLELVLELCRCTYVTKCGVSAPPPPPPLRCTSHSNLPTCKWNDQIPSVEFLGIQKWRISRIYFKNINLSGDLRRCKRKTPTANIWFKNYVRYYSF